MKNLRLIYKAGTLNTHFSRSVLTLWRTATYRQFHLLKKFRAFYETRSLVTVCTKASPLEDNLFHVNSLQIPHDIYIRSISILSFHLRSCPNFDQNSASDRTVPTISDSPNNIGQSQQYRTAPTISDSPNNIGQSQQYLLQVTTHDYVLRRGKTTKLIKQWSSLPRNFLQPLLFHLPYITSFSTAPCSVDIPQIPLDI